VLYDAFAPHLTLVIVVDPNHKDHRKPDFVGEVCPFFLLCIDEGSFCSMSNHERGTVAVTRQAPRATDGQALREQFKHLQVRGCAISVGTRSLNGEATTAVMPCILLFMSSNVLNSAAAISLRRSATPALQIFYWNFAGFIRHSLEKEVVAGFFRVFPPRLVGARYSAGHRFFSFDARRLSFNRVHPRTRLFRELQILREQVRLSRDGIPDWHQFNSAADSWHAADRSALLQLL